MNALISTNEPTSTAQPPITENYRGLPVSENALSDKQLAAVDLLAAGKGYSVTAQTLGICPKTLYNWRQDELFQEAVQERRQELWSQATDRVRALLNPSIDVMEQHLKAKYDVSRFRAASTLLRLASLHKALKGE